MKTIEINSIEWASEICDVFMNELSVHTGKSYILQDDDDCIVFTEEGQEIFNGLYDTVVDFIENRLDIDHSVAGNGIILAHTEEYEPYDRTNEVPF